MLLASYEHPTTIEPSVYSVWQESSATERNFDRIYTAFEAMQNDSFAGVEKVAVNADCSMIATKDSVRPRTVWIWSISSTSPSTVLNFREHIKQILWHPSITSLLLILTVQKDPTFYIWHDKSTAPSIGVIDLSTSGKGAGKFEGFWLPIRIRGQQIFMMSTPDAFDLGFLKCWSDRVCLESVLQKNYLKEELGPNMDESYTDPIRPEDDH